MKGFIFDLNGTMVDDMEYHNHAWFDLLNKELGANLSWDEVKHQMYGKNSELLIRVFGPDRFTGEEMDRLSLEKEKRYQSAYRPKLKLIEGLPEFLEKCSKHQVKMAIGSAAIPFNIDFVLDNLGIRHYFSAIVSANDVTHSKPDPETFLKGASEIGVHPDSCIVFEDAPKGVEAAANAGMKAVVLTTMHSREEFNSYKNIIGFIADYKDPLLDTLF
jgi:beta-phosphoglucomutase family hydrolase